MFNPGDKVRVWDAEQNSNNEMVVDDSWTESFYSDIVPNGVQVRWARCHYVNRDNKNEVFVHEAIDLVPFS